MTRPDSFGDDEVRELVRQAILEVLHSESSGVQPAQQTTSYHQEVPAQRELTLVLRGSHRAIELLERAVSDGEASLEIAVEASFGPKARVFGRRAGATSAQ